MTEHQMKNEAIVRMKMLKIYGNAIRDFRKKDRVLNKSEGYGALYWLHGVHMYPESLRVWRMLDDVVCVGKYA